MIHRLHRKHQLPCSVEEAWNFFSSPSNLKLITPPEMGFDIVGIIPSRMYAGLLIQYTVRPFFGIPTTWLTEITQVQEPYFFIDEQRVGPYKLWHHQHRFTPNEQGVEMEDIIHYIVPFGLLGELVHPLVRFQLQRIFDFRTIQIDRIFKEKN